MHHKIARFAMMSGEGRTRLVDSVVVKFVVKLVKLLKGNLSDLRNLFKSLQVVVCRCRVFSKNITYPPKNKLRRVAIGQFPIF